MATLITKETQTSIGETTCGICYTPLNNKNTVITTCKHAFCSDCFFTWLGRKETCALCRKSLLSNTLVEERLSELQEVQEELASNYRCLRRLKQKVLKRKNKVKQLETDASSLLNRQIRLRCLLEQTRSACRETLAHNKNLKHAMELQRQSLEMMKNYRKEWEELHKPLPVPSPPSPQEEKVAVDDIDIVRMTSELRDMVRVDRRRVRAYITNTHQEILEREAGITVVNSDDDDAEQQPDPEPEDEETETDTVVSTETESVGENEEIEVDLTVFGTGIPTFDFTTPPRRTVHLPGRPRRHRGQSPMFIFGQQSNSTLFTPIASSPSNVPRVYSNDWRREENSWPLNPGHTAMRRLFASPTQTDD